MALSSWWAVPASACDGHYAASLWQQLAASTKPRLSIACERACRLPPMHALRQDLRVEPPAFAALSALWRQAFAGEPAWDPDFGWRTFPLLLRAADMPAMPTPGPYWPLTKLVVDTRR